MSWVCKIFGHFMCSDTNNVAGPSSCKLCTHKEKAIEWPKPNNDTTKYKKIGEPEK